MMNMTRRRPPVPQMLPQSQRSAPPPAAAQVTASPAMSNPANLPQIQRRKEFLAEQLMQSQQGDGPDSVVEGLADLGSTAIQGYFLNKVSDQEQAAKAQTNDAFKRALASALQGGDATGLFTDGSYDNLDPGQQAIANALLERQFAGKDKPQRYEVGGNLIDENGNVVYQGEKELKPNPTRQIGRNGQIIDQEFVGGQWQDIGARAQFAPDKPKDPRQPNIITLYGPDGKPKSLYDTDPSVAGMLASGWTEAAPKSGAVLAQVGTDANGQPIFDYVAQAPKLTEDQSKAMNFASRMEASSPIIDQFESQGTDVLAKGLSNLPFGMGNYLQTPEYQQYNQAKEDFMRAVLRKESGAVISQEEMAGGDRQYFPQPGDGPDVIAQKKQNRRVALEAMKSAAGPGAQLIPGIVSRSSEGPQPSSVTQGGAPAPGAVEDGYRFKGGNPADPNNWEKVAN